MANAAVVEAKAQMAEIRRTQILSGAAEVFAEKGYHCATTKEIAQAAGVAEGTIYNYFHNKRELLVAMLELMATQLFKDIIVHQPPEEPRALLMAIMRDRYRLLQERGHLFAPILAEVFTDPALRSELYQQIVRPLAAYLEQYIQAHIDAGAFRAFDPLIVTRAFLGAMIVNFILKQTNLDARYETISAEAMMEQLVALFLGGLTANHTDRNQS